MKNILVAIDRKQEAEQLIAKAVEIAKLSKAKLWIIHVTEPDPDDFLAREAGPQYVYDKRSEKRKEEAAIIQEWVEALKKENEVEAEGLLIEGPVIKSLRKITEKHQIDLVVAGHRKKNFLYSLFTANKKKDLVDELNIPLLAVPLDKKHLK
ncbi:universal stress protein [Salegentibacter flavus]|uniref:Universal stress protein n=1 Tax=Salegentibacter flavus TaxID=287099 RepID=A0A1I5CAA3_9FLAO|nr:universal stress protein [Salegentibacter flavus]SFN83897.1 Nucleotide-binding universal stress protein, UspA family [Salegentibacter flavus]